MSLPFYAEPVGPLRMAYRIDAKDCLISVNDTSREFAIANGAREELVNGVIGTVLWSHIEGDSVREIYRGLTRRARAGRPVSFRYRCDSPKERRTFLMSIRADLSHSVDFLTDLIQTETRPSVRLLERDAERGEGFVRICAWCQRVAVSETEWHEVEQAVNLLGLLNAGELPGISHSMCGECAMKFVEMAGE